MELRDLYNSKKILTGKTIEKGQEIPQGNYYITVVVFVQNDMGEFLLQKRVEKRMVNGQLQVVIQSLEKAV